MLGCILMLVFMSRLYASIETEAHIFVQGLVNQAPPNTETEFNNRIQNKLSNLIPSENTNQKELENIQAQFEKNSDQEIKDADPMQQDLHRHLYQEQQSNPTVQVTQDLLQQKHRWILSENDSIFSGNKQLEDPSKIEHYEIDNIKQITCREGAKGETKTCTKKRVIKLVPGLASTRSIKISFSGKIFKGALLKIDLKNGSVSAMTAQDLAKLNFSHTDNMYLTLNNLFYYNVATPFSLSFNSSGNLRDEEASLDIIFSTAQITKHTNSNELIKTIIFEEPCFNNHYVAKIGLVHWEQWYAYYLPSYQFGFDVSWNMTIPSLQQSTDIWEGCEVLEDNTHCKEISLQKLELNETRNVEGSQLPIFREHWAEKKTFNCGIGTVANECEAIQRQGCEQIGSKCAIEKAGRCIEYEQTFHCAKVASSLDNQTIQSSVKDLISGKEISVPLENYDAAEFGQTITHFGTVTAMASPMQDNLGGITGNPDNPSIFHGECRRCTVTLGSSLKDCCHLKGIAQGLLGGCKEEEKQLANAAVKDKRCHKVSGKYCTHKVFGKCVEKKEAYCCYGSETARIIQEIAHYELDLSWGDGENPHCESLTASQLSRLNFDTPFAQAKLSQLVSEYQATAQDKFNQVHTKVNPSMDLTHKVEVLQQNLKQQFNSQSHNGMAQ